MARCREHARFVRIRSTQCTRAAAAPTTPPTFNAGRLTAMLTTRFAIALVLGSSAALVAQPAKHPLTLDDIKRMADVRDPQCSPDGQSVAYVVWCVDVQGDERQE